jgi:hypothetical protein
MRSIEPAARYSRIPSSIQATPSAVLPETLRAQPPKIFPPASQSPKL